jgi:hypothetical protein
LVEPETPRPEGEEGALPERRLDRARAAVEEDRIASMRTGPAHRLLFGSTSTIAGTVYGTIVVMATVVAGYQGEDTDAWRLAVVVAVTVLVLWVAHLYSHALADSIERGRRLDRAELGAIARREWSIPAAAAPPIAALVLAAFGVLGEQAAVWLALGIGLATLGVQGARYAALEQLGRTGTLTAIALNLLLGLTIVGVKVLLAH